MKKNLFCISGILLWLCAQHNLSAQIQAFEYSWEGGRVGSKYYIEQSEDTGLTLVAEYKNSSKKDIYLAEAKTPLDDGVLIKLHLDSDLTGKDTPKYWTEKASEQSDEKIRLIGYPIFQFIPRKISPGKRYIIRHQLEKLYPLIADVHTKSDIYMLWMKFEKIYLSADLRHPVVVSRAGGFYRYPGLHETKRETGATN